VAVAAEAQVVHLAAEVLAAWAAAQAVLPEAAQVDRLIAHHLLRHHLAEDHATTHQALQAQQDLRTVRPHLLRLDRRTDQAHQRDLLPVQHIHRIQQDLLELVTTLQGLRRVLRTVQHLRQDLHIDPHLQLVLATILRGLQRDRRTVQLHLQDQRIDRHLQLVLATILQDLQQDLRTVQLQRGHVTILRAALAQDQLLHVITHVRCQTILAAL
jgi:hypothetical protein